MPAHDPQAFAHDGRRGLQSRSFWILIHDFGFLPLQLVKNSTALLTEALRLIRAFNVIRLQRYLSESRFALRNVHRGESAKQIVAILGFLEH